MRRTRWAIWRDQGGGLSSGSYVPDPGHPEFDATDHAVPIDRAKTFPERDEAVAMLELMKSTSLWPDGYKGLFRVVPV